jgi:hypothetical protein
MKTLILHRRYFSHGVFGVLCDEFGNELCKIVERPWRDNQPGISCVPSGEYNLIPHRSPKFGACYALDGEQNDVTILGPSQRTHILIHIANFVEQLEGCIAVGAYSGAIQPPIPGLSGVYIFGSSLISIAYSQLDSTIPLFFKNVTSLTDATRLIALCLTFNAILTATIPYLTRFFITLSPVYQSFTGALLVSIPFVFFIFFEPNIYTCCAMILIFSFGEILEYSNFNVIIDTLSTSQKKASILVVVILEILVFL